MVLPNLVIPQGLSWSFLTCSFMKDHISMVMGEFGVPLPPADVTTGMFITQNMVGLKALSAQAPELPLNVLIKR